MPQDIAVERDEDPERGLPKLSGTVNLKQSASIRMYMSRKDDDAIDKSVLDFYSQRHGQLPEGLRPPAVFRPSIF